MMNKTDNSQVATKADIQRLEQSTKKDISKLEENLKKFATKSELKGVEKSLRSEILRVEEKVENVDEKLDMKFDDVLTKLDGIAKGLDDLRTDNEVGAHHTRELRVQVDNHEKRIKHLESPTSTA